MPAFILISRRDRAARAVHRANSCIRLVVLLVATSICLQAQLMEVHAQAWLPTSGIGHLGLVGRSVLGNVKKHGPYLGRILEMPMASHAENASLDHADGADLKMTTASRVERADLLDAGGKASGAKEVPPADGAEGVATRPAERALLGADGAVTATMTPLGEGRSFATRTLRCPAGFGHCDPRNETACMDILFDNQNCGSCGNTAPTRMDCENGSFKMRPPATPPAFVAMDAFVYTPRSGDLSEISQVYIHFRYNPVTMKPASRMSDIHPPPKDFGSACFVNGVDVIPRWEVPPGGSEHQVVVKPGVSPGMLNLLAGESDYAQYGYVGWELIFTVNNASTMARFSAGELCIYCELIDIPELGYYVKESSYYVLDETLGWRIPQCTSGQDFIDCKAYDLPEPISAWEYHQKYVRATKMLGTNNLTNIGGITTCDLKMADRPCQCVTGGGGPPQPPPPPASSPPPGGSNAGSKSSRIKIVLSVVGGVGAVIAIVAFALIRYKQQHGVATADTMGVREAATTRAHDLNAVSAMTPGHQVPISSSPPSISGEDHPDDSISPSNLTTNFVAQGPQGPEGGAISWFQRIMNRWLGRPGRGTFVP
eukprot:jgi/Mesvir1/27345/Mv07160-RA.2